MSVERFPLAWPTGWPRTPATVRKWSNFSKGRERHQYQKGATMVAAREELFRELELLGATHVVISSNVPVRLDGLPRANFTAPEDGGVVVYFTLRGKQQCIPCDRWIRAEDNLYAIAKTIDAIRGVERWGTHAIVDATFSGFTALPETAASARAGEAAAIQELATLAQVEVPALVSKEWCLDTQKSAIRQWHPDLVGPSGEEVCFKIDELVAKIIKALG